MAVMDVTAGENSFRIWDGDRDGSTPQWDRFAIPTAPLSMTTANWCGGNLMVGAVPPGLDSLLLGLPRTYVRGYLMPPLRGWGWVGWAASFLSECVAVNFVSDGDPQGRT